MASEMKNMAYWKIKNTLPGINPESDKNLPDGRSTSSPLQQTKFPIPRAKRLVRQNVKHTTIDSPDLGKSSEKRYVKAEKKITKAIEILRKKGYSEGQIEQATGAGGYKAAMDWATSKKSKKK
jgi:hypothetical protein